ncbi:MAG TPA: nucleoside kinase [Anaerolineae bacterium]|nr:nucleoside kinase [Anaerolineae bacterium]HIQ04126.1 nucleoside kinase [Anaerolineae bacterium]
MIHNMKTAQVTPASPRWTVQVRFEDGRIFEAPVGTPLEAFVQVAFSDSEPPVVAALVDGKLRELTYEVTRDIEATLVTMASHDGMRIYRRSLALLLVVATRELFPNAQLVVDHSLTFGGYFCRVEGREPLTAEELSRLEARMREIVAEDAPITKRHVSLEEAVSMFEQMGYDDKVRLLAHREKDYLTVYTLHNVPDYLQGYMVPSTGYLRFFALRPYLPGFVLQFPLYRQPTELQPFRDYPKLVAVFRQHTDWMQLMGVQDVGGLNQAMEAGRTREVVLVAEALHEQRIAEIAREIVRQRDQIRLVLIAGPSASGKTTFAKRLSVHLLANGVRPFPISLDDYFVDRGHTPRDEEGNLDFESLGALDLPLFNAQLLDLMAGREVTLPRYDFPSGQRQQGPTVRLGPEHVIVVEGIHGLNPDLVPLIPRECIYRIYVSALTLLNIDRHNRIPTTDTRLIRRIVRDAHYRNYSAEETILRWESVRRGEERNIFPYQEHADVMFNSALTYEMAALKPLAEPLLLQIEPESPAYVEARRLLAFLDWFLPCSSDLIPSDSILREFMGGSILRDFTP